MPRRRAARAAANARFIITLSIADRRPDHARADVRQVGELEQALHGAVLPVGTVEQREHDVDVERRACGGRRAARRIGHELADPAAGSPSTANATGSASAPAAIARRAASASNQRPSVVIATGTIS